MSTATRLLVLRHARRCLRATAPTQRMVQQPLLQLSGSNTSTLLQQSRGMVVVTQTKVEDLSRMDPTPEEAAAAAPSAPAVTNDDRLQITDACWNRIHALAAKRKDESVYLRLFVDAGGCSGFSYQFEFDTETPEEDDIIFSDGRGARLIVDEGSLDILKGSTIDFVQEMIKSSFEVKDNPQSESACGCGSSFALKNFAANPALD